MWLASGSGQSCPQLTDVPIVTQRDNDVKLWWENFIGHHYRMQEPLNMDDFPLEIGGQFSDAQFINMSFLRRNSRARVSDSSSTKTKRFLECSTLSLHQVKNEWFYFQELALTVGFVWMFADFVSLYAKKRSEPWKRSSKQWRSPWCTNMGGNRLSKNLWLWYEVSR